MGSGGSNASAGGGGGGATQQVTGQAGPGGPPEVVPPAKEIGMKPPNFPQDPVTNPGGTLTGPGVKVEQLSAAERASIEAYTGAHVAGGERFAGLNAEKLNRSLYDPEGFKRTLELAGESPASVADYVRRAAQYKAELNTALDKVRNYQGQVYRMISDSGGNLAAKYEVGKTTVLREFVSTSRSTNPSYKPFDMAGTGDTRFVIQSKTGKWVERVSRYGPEREVLFKSDTAFMTTKKVFNRERGSWDIYLTEL